MSKRSWIAASGALALTVTLAACANVPTSGTIQVSKLHGTAAIGQNSVQVVPKPPRRNWSPQDIVGSFLTASAFDPTHVIPRKYLTGGKHGFASKWRPGWQATIIDTETVKNAQPLGGKGITDPGGGPQPQVVEVTGKRITKLVSAGRYQAGSIVVGKANTVFRFGLVQVRGQWRINDISVNDGPANPSLLLLVKRDFEREYQSRNLYFYPASASRMTLIPDPVYIPARAGNEGIAGLVRTLITPGLGNGRSWLFGAAQTAFPPGTKLLSAQVVGGITAIVNLGGAAAKASPSQRQLMAAQLHWSLVDNQPYPSEAPSTISSVVLKINGQPVDQRQTFNDWVSHAPSGPLYYQVATGPEGPGVAWLRSKAPKTGSVPLPNPLAGQPFKATAVSAEPFGSAVVAGCTGKTVYLMPQSHEGQVITAQLPAPCTSLSWDQLGNLWVATKMQVYEIQGVGSQPPARPSVTDVLISQMQLGKAGIQSLQVAPDGVRVAMLIHDRTGSKIRIAAISKSQGQGTYIAQTDQVLRVGTDLTDPRSLTWLDPNHLLVLDRLGSGRTQLFDVPLNGGQSTPIATPHGVQSVTASWPSGQSEPSIAVAIPG
ncbi:MAG: LpqB family beta-propeller domain-containing protein, partial [Nocardiopsaceae bacterium]|nr:LpqB family beta-propeller domain-containing protein [Nocardiopsaceae bacterium]